MAYKNQTHYNRKYRYGITAAEFAALVSKQRNRCAICTKKFKNTPHVDHDHETKKVRGLLCLKCNAGLGQFLDNPIIIKAALDYLYA